MNIVDDEIKKYNEADKTELELNAFKIKGEIENNMGKIIIEIRTSKEFLRDFMADLWKNYPEGAQIPIGKYKAKLRKVY